MRMVEVEITMKVLRNLFWVMEIQFDDNNCMFFGHAVLKEPNGMYLIFVGTSVGD